MDQVKAIIIGAGVVGLAVAARLSETGGDIVVIERNSHYGLETSSRNSGVIHAGIYYPAGSLKAQLCVAGNRMLYSLCSACDIPHAATGKLIVAALESERQALTDLYRCGIENGISDISLLESDEVRRREPKVKAAAALYSPRTGIIDVHRLMDHYYRKAKAAGVVFAFNSDVEGIEHRSSHHVVAVRQDACRIAAPVVVNAAGLAADRVAALAGLDIDRKGYRLRLCKGTYFSYAKPSPVSMLVYPLPHRDLRGLGIHATLDLGGRLRFGPDAEFVEALDYRTDPSKGQTFYEGAASIIEGLDPRAFVPEMAGIRPKLAARGAGPRDFVIADEAGEGSPGFINLIGIESPGLTAAPAIAEYVSGMVVPYIA